MSKQVDLDALIADNREWVQLHRENKYQREAAKRMAGVLDALEAEHKRAEEATFVSKRVYTDVLAERDAAVQRADELRIGLRQERERAQTPTEDYPDAEGLATLRAQTPTDDERTRIEQSNDIAATVIEVAQNWEPSLFITLDFRYGIADALWDAGYRKVRRTVQGPKNSAQNSDDEREVLRRVREFATKERDSIRGQYGAGSSTYAGYANACDDILGILDDLSPYPDARRTVQGEPSPPDGWFPFGSHTPYPWVGRLEFSDEKDEAGMPLWERPVQGEPTATSIPRYAMLDVWMALYGHENSQAFDGFYEGAGYAEAWATLLAAIRARAAEPQGEPTDAQVLAALNAYDTRFPGEDLDDYQENEIADMRAALRAAREV